MDINATLFGQMITFGIFVWFTMKFVWPLLETAMQERQKKIADGLDAAEQGHLTLANAKKDSDQHLKQARERSHEIIQQANKQAAMILEQAKAEAQQEHDDIVAAGEKHLAQEVQQAKAQLKQETSAMAIAMAEKILERAISDQDQQTFLKQLASEG